uniref:Uncharacterized protein n=1 Tax=Rhizophora mucronata TaxID=61149 RepID=A0A2P2QNJ1_RHIMU
MVLDSISENSTSERHRETK